MYLVTVIFNLFTPTGNMATAKVTKTMTSSQITTPSQADAEFAILMMKIVKELQQNENENLATMKTICSYLRIGEDSGISLFNENQLEEIKACTNITDLFTAKLHHCWKWDNISSLKMIIQSLNSDACKKLLDQFEEKIDATMKLQSIYNHCKEENKALPDGFVKMVAIIKNKMFSTITKKEFDELTQFFSDKCGVYPCVMSLWQVSPFNSIMLEWLVPTTAVEHMEDNSLKNVDKFVMKSCLYLKISSKIIFDHRNPTVEVRKFIYVD